MAVETDTAQITPSNSDSSVAVSAQPTAPHTVSYPQSTKLHHQPASVMQQLLHLLARSIEFVALSLAAILLVEGIFRLCGIGQQEYLQPDPVLGCRHIPNQMVTWRMEGYSHERLSSVGLRDVEHFVAKPIGVKRIALLGDSSTEGLQVPLPATYARVLQKQLGSRYEVINFACSGYSTGQEYVQFKKEVEQYKPDITIVLYNCGDSLENIRDPGKSNVEPRPYFYIDAAGQLQQDDLLLKKLSPPGELLAFLQKNSRIYGVLKQVDLMLSINEKLYRKLRNAFCSMYAATAQAVQDARGGHSNAMPLQHLRQHRRGMAPSSTSLVNYRRGMAPPSASSVNYRRGMAVPCPLAHYLKPDGMQVTERLLLALNAECRHIGSRFIVVLFPNSNNNPQYAVEQKELRTFAAHNHLQMLDLTGAFAAAPDPADLFLQYHFSARGHKLVADQLAAEIKQ